EAGGLEDRRGRRRTLRSDRVGGSRPSRRHPCLAREIGREGALAGHRRRRRGLGGGDPEGQDREREAESGGHRTAQQTEHRETPWVGGWGLPSLSSAEGTRQD